MQELLIVNPARRPSKRRRSNPSAAQKRARAAFASAARARSSNPSRRRRRKNPAKRAATPSFMHNPRRRSSPKRRRRSVHARRRRNPIGIASKPLAMLTPALFGALGATAVNTALSYLPLPAAAMTGKMRYVTQAAAAIGLAAIAQKVGMKGSMATQMAEGSLTVTLYQAIVDIAAGAGMNLSGMGYYLPGIGAGMAIPSPSANAGRLLSGGMAKYVSGPGAPANVVPMRMAGMKKMRGFNF